MAQKQKPAPAGQPMGAQHKIKVPETAALLEKLEQVAKEPPTTKQIWVVCGCGDYSCPCGHFEEVEE